MERTSTNAANAFWYSRGSSKEESEKSQRTDPSEDDNDDSESKEETTNEESDKDPPYDVNDDSESKQEITNEESEKNQSTDSSYDETDDSETEEAIEIEDSEGLASTDTADDQQPCYSLLLISELEGDDKDTMPQMTLNNLVHKGVWKDVKRFLELHPNLLTTKISFYGDTALHIASSVGHVKIVQELVYMTDAKYLRIKNDYGETALSLAAGGGITRVAKPMVRKNHSLLRVKNTLGYIPVVVAAKFGHAEMVHFLYYETQEEDLHPDNTDQGAKLLYTCIIAQIFDVALELVQRFPVLAITRPMDPLKDPAGGTLNILATRRSSFPSGTPFSFWEQWIYSYMPISPLRVSRIRKDIEAYPGSTANRENIIILALKHLYQLVWDPLINLVPCIKRIHDTKIKHVQALKLLKCVSREISTLNHSQIKKTELFEAVFLAVDHGVDEFVEEILVAYPDIVWVLDGNSRNIFLSAVLQRREKIFSLLHEMGPRKNLIAASLDRCGNTILHHAAMLSPSSHLDNISGAALQMQRELQWFKEVENLAQPMYRELSNISGKTARSLFTKEHARLRREGEKWMKDTATSCTVVAALIATVMFAAAFTVPGGYKSDTGTPLYLHRESFMLFIVSDALSLFSSASSVLMFLGILKSRYTEDEFLSSLPWKLIIGVATLFFSIATMMLTFGTTIFILIHDRLTWISIPIFFLASIPVMTFLFPQVPLLYEVCVSTCGPGIFRRPRKRRYW